MPLWIAISRARFVGLVTLTLGTLALSGCRSQGSAPNARITVNCTPQSPTTFACTATSAGPDPARPCWDVIITCGATEHEAEKQCSKKLASGQSEVVTVPVSAFSPPIKGDPASCTGLHVDEMKLE
ncbi:MAG: hypothetical protein HY898_02480 [Deltaproteobacteria bacterium]|nr:hypothetical protein [Deltaproteobacteria bacterium]